MIHNITIRDSSRNPPGASGILQDYVGECKVQPSCGEDDIGAYTQDLNHAWRETSEDDDCGVVAADVSIPSDSRFQAVALALV